MSSYAKSRDSVPVTGTIAERYFEQCGLTRAINSTRQSSDLRAYSFVERRQAIRSAIVGLTSF